MKSTGRSPRSVDYKGDVCYEEIYNRKGSYRRVYRGLVGYFVVVGR